MLSTPNTAGSNLIYKFKKGKVKVKTVNVKKYLKKDYKFHHRKYVQSIEKETTIRKVNQTQNKNCKIY